MTEAATRQVDWRSSLRWFVLLLPAGLFIALIAASMARPDAFLTAATNANTWILTWFGAPIAVLAFLLVLLCAAAYVSPLGKIRLGGAEAKPLLSRWNWFAITLNTTIAIGIIFWATAEPIYHLANPGGEGSGIAPNGPDAQLFAMSTMFMHWTFTPYAIYTVTALAFALAYYNLDRPFSMAAPFSVLVGDRVPGWFAQIVDAICLTSLLFGLAASLGAGIMSIAGGIDRLTFLSSDTVLLGGVAIAIVATFIGSSISGLQRGIRILSDINTRFFVVLIVFVLIFGPTGDILLLGLKGAGSYLVDFVPRSLMLDGNTDAEWFGSWTVFYYCNWMAWAPLTAMFLGRIARGYTVREFILVNLVLPALFSMLWMTVFSGFALSVAGDHPEGLLGVMEADGPEFVLYAVLEYLPLTVVVSAVFVATSFLSYVTAADSNTDVLARLCQQDAEPASGPAMAGDDPDEAPGRLTMWLKLLWGVLVGAAAWIMVSTSGIDGVKMLSNLGGLPAFFIILALAVALILMMTVKRGRLKV